MTFVYPSFLWALAALALPIIIHLFNFRRYKKVYFSNVKFLKELLHESKSKSRLKEILVLIARCLAITCLVLAFCQPVIPSENSNAAVSGANAISLYIDNSFSMENVNSQGPVLEIAKTRAKEVIKAFGNADKFQIITNDFEGRHQRFNTKEDALNLIEEIKASPSLRLFTDVAKRQTDFLNSSGLKNRKIYCLSDAQKSTFNLEKFVSDTLVKTTLIPISANKINNVYVDSCWFDTPLQQQGMIQKLKAKIVNAGNSPIEVGSAKLFLNKKQIALASFSLQANSAEEVQFTFECKQSGFNYGSVKIEDYPVTFDDELFFSFNSAVNVAVTVINGKGLEVGNSIASLFTSDSLFKFNACSEQSIDYNLFKISDVIILNQLADLSSGLLSEILKFTAKGGALVIIPNEEANLQSYNVALTALKLPNLAYLDSTVLKTEKIEFGSGFYNGVFEKVEDRLNLPIVNKHFKLLQKSKSDFEPILKLLNGDDLLGYTKMDNASLFLFSSPFNGSCTNFDKHALFVPTFYQLSFKSLKSSPIFYPAGSNVIIHLKNDLTISEQPPHIKDLDNKTDIIPEVRVINNALFLYTHGQIKLPGFYEINRNKQSLLPLAFNYKREESDLSCYTAEELSKTISAKGWKAVSLIPDSQSDISGEILQGAEGKKLWKLFIILALTFIAIEVVLLKLLK